MLFITCHSYHNTPRKREKNSYFLLFLEPYYPQHLNKYQINQLWEYNISLIQPFPEIILSTKISETTYNWKKKYLSYTWDLGEPPLPLGFLRRWRRRPVGLLRSLWPPDNQTKCRAIPWRSSLEPWRCWPRGVPRHHPSPIVKKKPTINGFQLFWVFF